jgi:steroid delta-isomerase-like uncharacterized protein
VSAERNKATLRRYIEEVFNNGNLSVVEEYVTENYVVHTGLGIEIKGIEGVKEFVSRMRTGFPDLHGTIEHLVADEDEVAYRLTWQGTHKGEIFGQAPTGKLVTFTEVTFIRYEDNKGIEAWALGDRFGLMQQLGAIPTPNK